MDYSIAILAGGQSQRMGRNKALIEIEGIPILQRIINVVSGLTSDQMQALKWRASR